MKKIIIPIISFIVGFVVAMQLNVVSRYAGNLSQHSAFLSAKLYVENEIKEFKAENRIYPESLDELEFDWSQTDGATEQTLKAFYYERKNGSYLLWAPEKHYVIPMKERIEQGD